MENQKRNYITAEDAAKDFGQAARLAEKDGKVYITENGRPKYVLYDMDNSPPVEMTDDEKIDFVAARILREHKQVFLELAK